MLWKSGKVPLTIYEPKPQLIYTPLVEELARYDIAGVRHNRERDQTVIDCEVQKGHVVIPDHVAVRFTSTHKGKSVLTRQHTSAHVLINVMGGTVMQIGKQGTTGKQSPGFCQLAVMPDGSRPSAYRIPEEKIKVDVLGPRALVMQPSIICIRAASYSLPSAKDVCYFDVSIIQYDLTPNTDTEGLVSHADIGQICTKTVLSQTKRGQGISGVKSGNYDSELEESLKAAGCQNLTDAAIYAVEAASVWDWEYPERPLPLTPELEEVIRAIRKGDDLARARWSTLPFFCRAQEVTEETPAT